MFTKVDIEPLKKKVDEARAEVERLMALRDEAVQNENDAKNEVDSYDGQPDSPEKRAAEYNLTASRLKTVEVTNLLTGANKNLADSEKDVADASNKQQAATVKFLGKLDKISDGVSSIKSAFDSLTGTYKETAEAMGIAIGEEQLAFIDGISSGLGAVVGILSAITSGIKAVNAASKLLKMTNPELLAIAAALALLVGIVSTLNKLSLAKYNDEIKKHDLLIKGLEREYKNLDIEIEKLSGNDYIKGLKEQYAIVIEQMIEAQKKLEAARKKNKREEMETFQDEIDEKRRQAQELKDELAQTMLGSDIASAANSFADAWFEAYLSFADTAQAIKGEFKDMMKNMVINAMLTNVINTALVPVYKMIDDLSKDGYTADEVKQIHSLMLSIAPGLDEALKATISGVSSIMGDLYDKTENLSGLSKGIAGASEETVGILAGYMDSIRFRLFAYIDFMMANGQGNTMSSLMQAQTTQIVHLANIDANTLRSAIANEDLTKEVKKLISVSGSKGAYALNVNI